MNEFHRWCDVEALGRWRWAITRIPQRAPGERVDASEGSQETHQDRIMKEATLHFYRRDHDSVSAVTDVTPLLSAITALLRLRRKEWPWHWHTHPRRTAIAS